MRSHKAEHSGPEGLWADGGCQSWVLAPQEVKLQVQAPRWPEMAEDKETGPREGQGLSQIPRQASQLAQPTREPQRLPSLSSRSRTEEPGACNWAALGEKGCGGAGAGHIGESLTCPL